MVDIHHHRDGARKSPELLGGFFLSLLFLPIYFGCYVLLTRWLFLFLPVSGHMLCSNVICTCIVSLAGSLVCDLSFFLPYKTMVLTAYQYLALYFLICITAVIFQQDTQTKDMMLELICLYGLSPVLIGNSLAWLIGRKLKGIRIKKHSSGHEKRRLPLPGLRAKIPSETTK